MKHFPLFQTIFCLFILFQTTQAGENDGVTGLSFLKVGVGARAGGMGEAYTAVANDALASYWNPANLMAAGTSNLALMHNSWLLDVNSQFGAVQFSGKSSSLALHVYTLYVDDIPVRDRPTENPLEQTGANYLSMGVSYARSFSKALDLGVTVKYLFEKVYFYSAGGYALDFGARYRAGERLTLGGTLQNIGSMGKLLDESSDLPALLRLGAAYELGAPVGDLDLLLAGDLVMPLDEDIRLHLGLEAGVWKALQLRTGYMGGYENRGITLGAGINKTAYKIDFSYTPFNDDLGSSERISFHLSL